MKNKKLIVLAVAGLLTVGAIGAGTIAYFTDQDTAENVITMGHVDIRLDEPGWSNPDNVNPGDAFEKYPTITIEDGSENAYIRVLMEIKLTDQAGNDVLDEKGNPVSVDANDILVINDGWNPTPDTDGYYYYNTAMSAKDANKSIEFFKKDANGKTVKIPSSWGNLYADKKLTINIKAEAIQEDNFTPAKNTDGNIIGWFLEDGTTKVTTENYNK